MYPDIFLGLLAGMQLWFVLQAGSKAGVLGQVEEVDRGKAEVAPPFRVVVKPWEIWGHSQRKEDACEAELANTSVYLFPYLDFYSSLTNSSLQQYSHSGCLGTRSL